MNKPLVIVAALVGIVLVVAAVIYFSMPASSLPNFFPGYESGLSTHHYKHGIGALLLGIGCFIFAWFQSGKKSVKEEKNG